MTDDEPLTMQDIQGELDAQLALACMTRADLRALWDEEGGCGGCLMTHLSQLGHPRLGGLAFILDREDI